MCLKIFQTSPYNSSSRGRLFLRKSLLSRVSRVLKVKSSINKRWGRSTSMGHITSWHRGGGAKKKHVFLSFFLPKSLSVCVLNEYDTYSSNFRTLEFELRLRKFRYRSSTKFVSPGTLVSSGLVNSDLSLGSFFYLKDIPPGSQVHNICKDLNFGPKYVKSGGCSATVIQTASGVSFLRFPSGKIIKIDSHCMAMLGCADNSNHNKTRMSKAGQNRWRGWRPHVRGISMNPVDHPHGGRTNGGRPSVTPWGLPTKSGFRLRKK